MTNQPHEITAIDPPDPAITIEVVPRRLRMHNITEQEMGVFASGYGSIHSAFFGVALGAAIAFLITLTTVKLDDRAFTTYAALLAVSAVLTVYFGVMWLRDRSKAMTQFDEIKSR